MQDVGGREAYAESSAESGLRGMTGCGPLILAARISQHGREGRLGALKRHRHPIAGKRRNHRAGIAELDPVVGGRSVLIEGEGSIALLDDRDLARYADSAASLQRITAAEVPARFGFVQDPKPA